MRCHCCSGPPLEPWTAPDRPLAHWASSNALVSENPKVHLAWRGNRNPASSTRAAPQPPPTVNTASTVGSCQAAERSATRSWSVAEKYRHCPFTLSGISSCHPWASQRSVRDTRSVSGSIQVPGLTARIRDPWRKGAGRGEGPAPEARATAENKAVAPAVAPASSSERRLRITAEASEAWGVHRCRRWRDHRPVQGVASAPSHCHWHW